MKMLTMKDLARRWEVDPATAMARLKLARVPIEKSRDNETRRFIYRFPLEIIEAAEEGPLKDIIEPLYSAEETQRRAEAALRGAFKTPAPHRVRVVPDSIETPCETDTSTDITSPENER